MPYRSHRTNMCARNGLPCRSYPMIYLDDLDDVDGLDDDVDRTCLMCVYTLSPLPQGMLRMRGEYGIMVDADAATDIRDLDRLLIRMREIEREEVVQGRRGDSRVKHGMVVGSRAHMEGDAVAKVMLSGRSMGWDAAGPATTVATVVVTVTCVCNCSCGCICTCNCNCSCTCNCTEPVTAVSVTNCNCFCNCIVTVTTGTIPVTVL